MFLAAESKIKGENDRKKYEKARRLKQNIASIRVNYNEKIRSKDPVDNQLGVCTFLIDNLALRVGNEKGEEEADTVGCCSLKVKNVEFPEANVIKLDFLGKDSIRYENTVPVPTHVYDSLVRFSKGKEPDDLLFDRINTGRLNDYLKSMMDELSAKVFRTFNASITLQNQLCVENEFGIEPSSSADLNLEKRLQFYNKCNREVARLCNHQKAVAKNFEEQVDKMRQKLYQRHDRLKALQDLLPKLKKGNTSSDPKMPKTLEQCKSQIEKEQHGISVDEARL